MKKRRIAALSIQLENAGPRVQLFPAGVFRGVDGRPTDAPHWFIDAAIAQTLIDTANARQTPYCFDYEHQSLHAQTNGKPAPAAGWFKTLEWVESVGLFAVDVAWTDTARTMIEKDEYLFISPLFNYDAQGNVKRLINAALTNVPALDGMEALIAAASQQLTGEDSVDELLEQLRWLLNLPLSATAEDIQTELKKIIARISEGKGTAAASVNLLALITEKDDKIAALSQAPATTPDPTQFAPVSVVNELRGQIAALSQQLSGGEIDTLLTAALSDGRLTKGADEDWARRLGEKDITLLREHLTTRQPIAALSAMQTGGKPPAEQPPKGSPGNDLDQDKQAACSAFGHDPKEIARLMNEDA